MHLEYLPDGSPDCPLIRLYGFDRDEARRLRDLFEALAGGARDHVALHDEPGVEVHGACRLHLRAGVEDRGIFEGPAGHFQCALSPSGWEQLAALVQPFCDSDAAGFQWLDEHGDIALLVSCDGWW